MNYYRLKDDVQYPGRWLLGDVLDVDNWVLVSQGGGAGPVQIELYRDGVELDFTFSEVYGVPVVSAKVKNILIGLPGLEFIPASVVPPISSRDFYIVVVSKQVDCVDEDKSEFTKFEINDPVRPDKAGQYRGFMNLKLDPLKVAGMNIFRVAKFNVAIVVSETIKKSFEAAAVTGLRFESVV
ncbi:imm11 family protein [Pseudomonas quasicaspiana]|uniref:imm11 family protein n=1 Tax=Pseudomonas quasicaspiana TaxID=2829821 RepID=UPI001E2E4F8D|nr:DUF1629 domain-containing protein [Pseudomonas quasicaspiana]MCD5977721.1 hypothetical protein [Pseudomonas quasicaspiana]